MKSKAHISCLLISTVLMNIACSEQKRDDSKENTLVAYDEKRAIFMWTNIIPREKQEPVLCWYKADLDRKTYKDFAASNEYEMTLLKWGKDIHAINTKGITREDIAKGFTQAIAGKQSSSVIDKVGGILGTLSAVLGGATKVAGTAAEISSAFSSLGSAFSGTPGGASRPPAGPAPVVTAPVVTTPGAPATAPVPPRAPLNIAQPQFNFLGSILGTVSALTTGVGAVQTAVGVVSSVFGMFKKESAQDKVAKNENGIQDKSLEAIGKELADSLQLTSVDSIPVMQLISKTIEYAGKSAATGVDCPSPGVFAQAFINAKLNPPVPGAAAIKPIPAGVCFNEEQYRLSNPSIAVFIDPTKAGVPGYYMSGLDHFTRVGYQQGIQGCMQ